jgi:DNA-directed RNA polymerase subunit RPC12/RpoP
MMPAAASSRPDDDYLSPASEIAAALDRLALAGFPATMEVARDHVRCGACGSRLATKDVRWQKIEMVSALDAVHVVGGIRCPVCGTGGTATTTLDLLRG